MRGNTKIVEDQSPDVHLPHHHRHDHHHQHLMNIFQQFPLTLLFEVKEMKRDRLKEREIHSGGKKELNFFRTNNNNTR